MQTTFIPLSVIYNNKAGFHRLQHQVLDQQILDLWQAAGFNVQIFEITPAQPLQYLMQQVLARHQQPPQGTIVVAGGDGTLNAVVQYLVHHDIALGILPLGTFNYVARALEIPLDLSQAAQVIAAGITTQVHVARINQYLYLNNASLGLYPLFIQKREAYTRYLGRFTLHAYTSALDVLIRDRKALKLEVDVDGKRYPVKTPLVFLGNNQLQLKNMNLNIAQAAADGKVAGVVVGKTDKLSLFKMLWQLIRGRLDETPDVYNFSAEQVVIHSRAKKLSLAIDGELMKIKPPLHIWVDRAALKVVVPHVITSV